MAYANMSGTHGWKLLRIKLARAWSFAMEGHPEAFPGFEVREITHVDGAGRVVRRRRLASAWDLVQVLERKALRMVEANVEAELAQRGVVLPATLRKKGRRRLNAWLRGGK